MNQAPVVFRWKKVTTQVVAADGRPRRSSSEARLRGLALESEDQGVEEIGALLVHGCEIRVNDAVGIGPLLGPEAAGDFLFDLGHAHGLLGQVVGERNAGIRGKAPDIVGVGAQAQEEVRRLALPGTPAFARGWSPGMEVLPLH